MSATIQASPVEKLSPIEEAWAQLPTRDVPNYAAGTEGPAAWHELLENRGNAAAHAIGRDSLA